MNLKTNSNSMLSVSPGELEACCHVHEAGPPGRKGEPGSPGKTYIRPFWGKAQCQLQFNFLKVSQYG